MHCSSAGKYRFRLRAEHGNYVIDINYNQRLKKWEREGDIKLFVIYWDVFTNRIVFHERRGGYTNIFYSVRVIGNGLKVESMSARSYLSRKTGTVIAVDDVIRRLHFLVTWNHRSCSINCHDVIGCVNQRETIIDMYNNIIKIDSFAWPSFANMYISTAGTNKASLETGE